MYNNKLLIPTYTGTYTEIFLNACCTHKNCRFGEVSFLAPVYKSTRISATQRPIRNKFGTNVEKGRLVRNPQKNWKFFVPTYGPFPRGRSHIIIIYNYLFIYFRPYVVHVPLTRYAQTSDRLVEVQRSI